MDTASFVELNFPNTQSIFVKPNILNCCSSYINPIDSVWYIYVETGYYREGVFNINNNICEQFDIECCPTSILIDKNGKIIFKACSETDYAQLEELLGRLLK